MSPEEVAAERGIEEMEEQLEALYREIAEKVNEMIPEAWSKFYYYAQISETGGRVYFFYKSEQHGDYIYNLDIPKLFEIDKNQFKMDKHELYLLSEKIREIFKENQQELWYSFTISLDDKVKFEMSYDYTDWFKTDYFFGAQLAIWKYKYLNLKPQDEELQEALERYLVEYPNNPI